MKTQQNTKTAAGSMAGNSIKTNGARARARAAMLCDPSGTVARAAAVTLCNASRARAAAAAGILSGAITAAEAAQRVAVSAPLVTVAAADMGRGRMAARGLFDSPAGRGALVAPPVTASGDLAGDDLRALRAGLLTLADVEAMAAGEVKAAAVEAARRDRLRAAGAWSARESARRAAEVVARAAVNCSAHVVSWEELAGAREDAARARRYAFARESGLFESVAMAALGSHLPSGAREAMAKERAAGFGFAAGSDSWHSVEAAAARARWVALNLAEVRAGAGRLLAAGISGRAAARGCRIALGMSRRWMRRNSRREAANIAEVGGAGGVDDRQAWADWSAELAAIARGVHLQAAAFGAAMVSAPLGPCRELVARGLTLGAVSNLQAAVLGRGKRKDGAPVVEWTDKGRQVREDSIGIDNRGAVWVWAARQAGREMHSARYGRGGRDGREVAACWSANGTIKGEDFGRVHVEGAAAWQSVPSRRPSFVVAIRSALSNDLREARAALSAARWLVEVAPTSEDKQRAGSKLGAAIVNLSSATARAKAITAAMGGASLGDGGRARWVEFKGGKDVLTSSGRMFAKRFRAAFPDLARKIAKQGKAAFPVSGVIPGDETAAVSDESAAKVAAMVAG